MDRAGNEDIDKKLDVEKKRLGIPSTKAGIKVNNYIYTDKAINLVTVIPDESKSPKLTSE